MARGLTWLWRDCFTISPIYTHTYFPPSMSPISASKSVPMADYYRENGNVSNVLDYCGRNNIGDKRADKLIIFAARRFLADFYVCLYTLALVLAQWEWTIITIFPIYSFRTTRHRVQIIYISWIYKLYIVSLCYGWYYSVFSPPI